MDTCFNIGLGSERVWYAVWRYILYTIDRARMWWGIECLCNWPAQANQDFWVGPDPEEGLTPRMEFPSSRLQVAGEGSHNDGTEFTRYFSLDCLSLPLLYPRSESLLRDWSSIFLILSSDRWDWGVRSHLVSYWRMVPPAVVIGLSPFLWFF